jgi:hypothetical protein
MIRLCGFAARKRSARYDRTNLHPHREPETRVSPCLARKHRRDQLRPGVAQTMRRATDVVFVEAA